MINTQSLATQGSFPLNTYSLATQGFVYQFEVVLDFGGSTGETAAVDLNIFIPPTQIGSLASTGESAFLDLKVYPVEKDYGGSNEIQSYQSKQLLTVYVMLNNRVWDTFVAYERTKVRVEILKFGEEKPTVSLSLREE